MSIFASSPLPLPEHLEKLRKFISFVEHMTIEEKLGRLDAAEATQVLMHAVPAALENCGYLPRAKPSLVRQLQHLRLGWG